MATMDNLTAGADNLLLDSMGIGPDQRMLVVEEPDDCTLFEKRFADFIVQHAGFHGVTSVRRSPALVADPKDFPRDILQMMQEVDHTLFLSRLGDYCRFTNLEAPCSKTICYVRSLDMLGSAFAGTCNRLFHSLLERFESELFAAREWRIRCPLGTDIRGGFAWDQDSEGEFSMNLFPVTTFRPAPCGTADGRVALSRWLMPGGAPKVDNARLMLDETIVAEVSNGELTGFTGSIESVRAANDHYDHVAGTLGINRNRIHSWHAGMNPFTRFDGDLATDRGLAEWEAISFASPRYLHMHTCGDIPPGEISWSVFNPTVEVDGQTLWEDGQFLWLQRPDIRPMLDASPGALALLETSADIGVGR